MTTRCALHDVGLGALVRLMADLVAFEAELGIALERVVGVLAAEDAVRAAASVGALARHVAELFAVATFDSRVRLDIVAGHLVFHPREHVVLHALVIVVARLLHRVLHLAVFTADLPLVLLVGEVHVAAKVHVAFDGAARDDQVRIALRVDGGNVVVGLPVLLLLLLAEGRDGVLRVVALSILGKEVGVVSLPHHARRGGLAQAAADFSLLRDLPGCGWLLWWLREGGLGAPGLLAVVDLLEPVKFGYHSGSNCLPIWSGDGRVSGSRLWLARLSLRFGQGGGMFKLTTSNLINYPFYY